MTGAPAKVVGKPFITANQVTLLRMVLLPVPCAMVLYGSVPMQWWSLILYTLLGITDWVDGRMARHYGPTVLGGLLDPVADKVFMAAVIMPLNAFHMVHPGVIMAILFREFLITSLRSTMSLQGADVKTSVLAKLKTAVQMVGAGFVFVIYRSPDDVTNLWILGVLGGGGLAVLVWRLVAVKRAGPLLSVPVGLICFAFLVRWTLDFDDAVLVHWGVVLVFTWASALDYLSGAGAVLKPGGRVEGLARLVWSLVVGLWLPYVMTALPEVTPIWVLLLGGELTSGAVDNLRCHAKEPPRVWIYPLRALVMGVGAYAIMQLPSTGHPGSPAFWGGLVLALVSAAWTGADFVAAKTIIWGADAVPPQAAQGSVSR